MSHSINSEATLLLKRARRIYSQAALAEKLQISVRTIANWESKGPPAREALTLKSLLRPSRYGKAGNDFTFIDLFAGIGGIRMGFEAAGGKCVFTSEWDEYAQKTYRANFPEDHKIVGDINLVSAPELSDSEVDKLVPDHDVLLAGFPCQPFSIAGVSKKNALGRPHGFACKTQGTLFFNVARILEVKRPPAFLLENVKNLKSHDKGRTFATIMETLTEDLGYKVVEARIIDAKHFVPQHRERILIVGFRESTDFDFDALLKSLPAKTHTMKDILHEKKEVASDIDGEKYLGKKGQVLEKYTLSDKLWDYLQRYAEKHRARGNGFGCSVVGPDNTARTLSARYYKDGSEILVSRGEGKNPRRLTPRECARLMGFDDDFCIPVSDTRAYKQFGNSVVVPVIEAVAGHMRQHIIDLKKHAGKQSRRTKAA